MSCWYDMLLLQLVSLSLIQSQYEFSFKLVCGVTCDVGDVQARGGTRVRCMWKWVSIGCIAGDFAPRMTVRVQCDARIGSHCTVVLHMNLEWGTVCERALHVRHCRKVATAHTPSPV